MSDFIRGSGFKLYIVDLSTEEKELTPYFIFEIGASSFKFVSKNKILYLDPDENVRVFDISSKSSKFLFSFDRFGHVRKGVTFQVYEEANGMLSTEKRDIFISRQMAYAVTNKDETIFVIIMAANEFSPGSDSDDSDDPEGGLMDEFYDSVMFMIDTKDLDNPWKVFLSSEDDLDVLIKDEKLYMVTPSSLSVFDLSKRTLLYLIRKMTSVSGIFRTIDNVYLRRGDGLFRVDETGTRLTLVPEKWEVKAESSFDVAITDEMREQYDRSHTSSDRFFSHTNVNEIIELIPKLRTFLNLGRTKIHGPGQYVVVDNNLRSIGLAGSESLIRFLVKYCSNRDPDYFASSKEELVQLIEMNL